MFYPDIWNEFVQRGYCHGARQREYPEWHKQRERYYFWALDVDSLLVHDLVREYQKKLSGFLVDDYFRQSHITLAISGFLTDLPKYNDDITRLAIEQQANRLQSLNLLPFELSAGCMNSFSSAPFIEISDKDHSLDSVRQALTLSHNDFRTTRYVPHITIGVYNADYRNARIVEILANAESTPVKIPVDRIILYSYSATDIGSLLREEQVIWL